MISRMKVLVICTVKFDCNGVTNVILNYYRAMDKSDMQIDFVIPNVPRGDLRNEIEKSGSKIYVLDNRMKSPISYMLNLSNLIKSEGYNIVHAHGNSCTLALEMYAAKKSGVLVRIPHAHSTSCTHIIAHKMLRPVFERSYTYPFACGEKAGKWLYQDKPFKVVTNGINVKKFTFSQTSRQNYREKMGLVGKKVIGHIGHFSYSKNHKFLVEIFYELYKKDNDYRLLLIGDGKLRKEIEQNVLDLGISENVVFTGKRTDIPQLMSVMDIFVMPSHFEGFPLTLVEAQAACLPCFVSDRVSKEVKITNLIGFISLEKSPKEWATIINESNLINREECKSHVCNKIIKAGYSITDNARRMKKLYKLYSA